MTSHVLGGEAIVLDRKKCSTSALQRCCAMVTSSKGGGADEGF